MLPAGRGKLSLQKWESDARTHVGCVQSIATSQCHLQIRSISMSCAMRDTKVFMHKLRSCLANPDRLSHAQRTQKQAYDRHTVHWSFEGPRGLIAKLMPPPQSLNPAFEPLPTCRTQAEVPVQMIRRSPVWFKKWDEVLPCWKIHVTLDKDLPLLLLHSRKVRSASWGTRELPLGFPVVEDELNLARYLTSSTVQHSDVDAPLGVERAVMSRMAVWKGSAAKAARQPDCNMYTKHTGYKPGGWHKPRSAACQKS